MYMQCLKRVISTIFIFDLIVTHLIHQGIGHILTEECWDKCVTDRPGQKLGSSTEVGLEMADLMFTFELICSFLHVWTQII